MSGQRIPLEQLGPRSASDLDDFESESDYSGSEEPSYNQNDGLKSENYYQNQQGTKINEESNKPTYSFYQYVKAELTRGYYLEQDAAKYTEKRKRVYTFMLIPRKLEKFMLFGFFQCADAFLYLFTFLPIRVLHACISLCTRPCGFTQSGSSTSVLEAAQFCDVLKGIILAVCCGLITYVDTSMLYHIIRGQAIIKLYIFFNMLEIADRLFASFGQDILDSLSWTAAEPRDRKREHIGLIPHLLLAIIYVFLHACLVLFQATTLNVAFNSHNKALLTIMMSNNFVEIKGAVFKKFAKNNLFQMSCSDVRERFHYMVLLAIVVIRNMTEFAWDIEHLWQLVPDIIMVLLSECVVDWLKHAFIVKFNDIPSDVYEEYTVSLAYDTAISRQKNAFSDHSDLVSRRMGFTPLPLACLLFRVLNQSLKVQGYLSILLVIVAYFCLLTVKILNSIMLLGSACDNITEFRERKAKAAEEARERARAARLRRYSVGNERMNVKRPRVPKRCMSEATIPTLSQVFCSATGVLIGRIGENRSPDMPPSGEATPGGSPRKTGDLHDRTPRTRQSSEKSDFTDDKPPLSDIDRYSMCSNRIV